MLDKLKYILTKEKEALQRLLSLLDEQYTCVMKKDVFAMDKIVTNIQLANKEVAQLEVQRRNIVSDKSMKEIVFSSGDEELENIYRAIVKLLEEVVLQKDTNELLIKQQLSLTNQILGYINPNRDTKTYNSYGKMKR